VILDYSHQVHYGGGYRLYYFSKNILANNGAADLSNMVDVLVNLILQLLLEFFGIVY